MGTAGSYAIELLSKIGISNFVIIDYDIVEKKNLISQNYVTNDIGQYKVNCLLQKYPSLKITPIIHKVKNYNDLKQILDEHPTNYLLTNADDSSLIIETIGKIFTDFPHIKIIESGYNISEVQADLITKENAHYFKNQFENLKKFFTNNGDFKGLADNSGTIFHSVLNAFFSAKFIFDDITHISSPEFAQFNLLENKYYLDNLFYRHEFTQYIQRYRKDSQIIRQDDLINDGDEEDTSDSDPIEQMFYSEEDNWEALTYFSHIKNQYCTSEPYDSISIDELHKLLFEYSQHTFSSKQFNISKIDERLSIYATPSVYNKHRTYTEHLKNSYNRIYIGDLSIQKEITFIQEYFHSLCSEISENEHDHLYFSIKNTNRFTLELLMKKNKIGRHIGESLLRTYIEVYINLFIQTHFHKAKYLNTISDFISQASDKLNMNRDELLNRISSFKNLNTNPYDITKLRTIENQLSYISQIDKALKELR